jgi:hypothetical protein
MNLLIAAPSLGSLTGYNRCLMSDQFVRRLAQPSDFAFCQRLYFEGMGWIIEALKLDMARQRESFGQQYRATSEYLIDDWKGRRASSGGWRPPQNSNQRPAIYFSGTDGSNPSLSSAESVANLHVSAGLDRAEQARCKVNSPVM